MTALRASMLIDVELNSSVIINFQTKKIPGSAGDFSKLVLRLFQLR